MKGKSSYTDSLRSDDGTVHVVIQIIKKLPHVIKDLKKNKRKAVQCSGHRKGEERESFTHFSSFHPSIPEFFLLIPFIVARGGEVELVPKKEFGD